MVESTVGEARQPVAEGMRVLDAREAEAELGIAGLEQLAPADAALRRELAQPDAVLQPEPEAVAPAAVPRRPSEGEADPDEIDHRIASMFTLPLPGRVGHGEPAVASPQHLRRPLVPSSLDEGDGAAAGPRTDVGHQRKAIGALARTRPDPGEIDPRIASMFQLPPRLAQVELPSGKSPGEAPGESDNGGAPPRLVRLTDPEPIDLIEDPEPEADIPAEHLDQLALDDISAATAGANPRARLGRTMRIAQTKLEEVERAVAGQVAAVDGEREQGAELARGEAEQLREQARSDAKVVREEASLRRSEAQKGVSREELAARVSAESEKRRTQIDQTFHGKTQELEGQLARRKAELDAEAEAQATRLQQEIASRQTALEADIEKRKAAHLASIEQEKPRLELQAKKDTDTARSDALEQAQELRATATGEADRVEKTAASSAADTRKKGDVEAARAIQIGEGQAEEARKAAETRAADLDKRGNGDEASQVRAEGQRRVEMARAEAKGRAEKMKSDARESADKNLRTAAEKSTGIRKDGKDRAEDAIRRGEEAAARIKATLETAIAAMHAEVDKAVAAMNKELAELTAKGDAELKQLVERCERERPQQEALIEEERTRALAAIEAEHAKATAAIDERQRADLARIESAGEQELARLEQEIERDLQRLDAELQAAERRIDSAIASADRVVAADSARRQQRIRAEGATATAAIHRQVAQAEREIAAADRGVDAAIDRAAETGLTELAAEGDRLIQRNAAQAEKDGARLHAAGDAAVEQSTREAERTCEKLESDRRSLSADITKVWVDDAVARAEANLDDNGFLDLAKDEDEAKAAMNIINSLPPGAQRDVIGRMSDESFANLLDKVPADRHEEFASMVANTNDPERKLALFDKQHRSYVVNEAERRGANETEAQRARRKEIAGTTLREMDEEMAHLRAEAKGKGLTLKQVDELCWRKLRENEIENNRRINITNDPGKANGGEGVRRVWSTEELDHLDHALSLLPPEHVETVAAYQRGDARGTDMANYNPNDHKLRFYDSMFKHDDETGTIVHEVAHAVAGAASQPAAIKDYQDQLDWKEYDRDALRKQLMKDGLSEADADAVADHLDSERSKSGQDREGIIVGNRRYDSRGTDGYDSYDIDGMPGQDEVNPTDRGYGWEDEWEYGRASDEHEVFAEHYRIAVEDPERAYDDFITGPQEKVERLRATGASQEEIRAAEKHAQKMKKQYTRMREGVFGVDDAAVNRAADSLPPELRDDFIAEANGDPSSPAKVMTPHQLEQLRKQYEQKANGGP